MCDLDSSEIQSHAARTLALREASRSENTRLAYEKSWRSFTKWCQSKNLNPNLAETEDVVKFLVEMGIEVQAGRNRPLSLNTLRLYRSGLNDRWRRVGLPSPAAAKIVDEVLQGLTRMRNESPRRVKALREHQILAMLNSCNSSVYGLRDAALLSLGFAAALRRSELCDLRIDDLSRKGKEGMAIRVRRSKTDQEGTGQTIAVLAGKIVRPVEHVERWLSAANIRTGFVFQTLLVGGVSSGRPLDPGDVARVVKRYAHKVGLDPREYSGHSLRAGFVTSAAVHHARIDKIMEVTRHRNAETVLKYIRDEESFIDHAGASFL